MTTTGELLALDLASDVLLGDTFIHNDKIMNATWTLRPLASDDYQKRQKERLRENPQMKAYAGLLGKTQFRNQLMDQLSSDAGRLRSMLGAGEVAVDSETLAREMSAEWERIKAAADDEVGKLGDVDFFEVQRKLEDQAKADVKELLIIKVDGVPALQSKCADGHTWQTGATACPECGAESSTVDHVEATLEGPAAAGLLDHPQIGDRLYRDLMQALREHAEGAAKQLELEAGN